MICPHCGHSKVYRHNTKDNRRIGTFCAHCCRLIKIETRKKQTASSN